MSTVDLQNEFAVSL